MLILSRKKQESVVVGGANGVAGVLKVTVLEIARGKVKLGFEAADDVPVHRLEIWERMCATGELNRRSGDLESPPARIG
jgi:carbon storage regulator CsrA